MLLMVFLMLGSLLFTVQGVAMHQQVNTAEERFHQLQDQYYTLSKATRDSARTGSELNKKLVELQQTPSELLRLKLVGVGKILTGIFILLFGILIALMMMPVKLAGVIKQRMQQTTKG